MRNNHNHEPDERQSQRLITKMAALKAATTASEELRATFDNATREEAGAHLVSFNDVNRTMHRRQRKTYPPAPTDADAADEFMRSLDYSDKTFSKYYQGMVSSDDGGRGLIYAHPGNLAKLNEDTKTLQCDGTFRYG